MDEFLAYLQQVDPLWSVVLIAAALGVLFFARLLRASFLGVFALLSFLVLLGAVAAAGYYGYYFLDDMRRIEERRALDERAGTLLTKYVEPESVFACIDGSPAPAMQEACERNLFSEPQRVAAAVAIVTQRLAFLADAVRFATERDPAYFNNIESMRKATEEDPYGFVAFVLSVEHGCTVDACSRYELLRDPTRVKENMRGRRLEAYMAKYSAAWRGSSVLPEDSAPAAGTHNSSPLVTISGDPSAAPGEGEREGALPVPAAVAAPAPEAAVSLVIAPLLPPRSAASAAVEPPAAAALPVLVPAAEAEGFAAPPLPPEPPAPSTPPARAAAKGKAKAAPAPPRSSEPVAGLPRVVPSDYARGQEAVRAEAPGQPGAPTPIVPPQQNLTVR